MQIDKDNNKSEVKKEVKSEKQKEIKLHKEMISYKDGDVELEGYLVYNENLDGKLPGVIVAHAWMGLDDYAKKRADQLAEMGYIAFALDIYGKGVKAKDHKEAAKLMGIYASDRKLLRSRAKAGFDVISNHKKCDYDKIAAMGYCFGGITVLEMGRSGLDVKGIVTFHGFFSNPNPYSAKNIKGKVLVFHGDKDPFLKPDELGNFEKEMKAANAKFEIIRFKDAVHAFTVKKAGNDPSNGAAYNENADKISWEKTTDFFNEILK
ncbi:MAG: dienelactone hydrolase family protein [Okeania sp. SIO3B3]|nr:dienelactone hydrolase family protein [Okeania sp. SIO3B3]